MGPGSLDRFGSEERDMYSLVMKNMLRKQPYCKIFLILISHLDYVGLLEAQKKHYQGKLIFKVGTRSRFITFDRNCS